MRYQPSVSISDFLGPKIGLDEIGAQGLQEDAKTFGQQVLDIGKTHGVECLHKPQLLLKLQCPAIGAGCSTRSSGSIWWCHEWCY